MTSQILTENSGREPHREGLRLTPTTRDRRRSINVGDPVFPGAGEAPTTPITRLPNVSTRMEDRRPALPILDVHRLQPPIGYVESPIRAELPSKILASFWADTKVPRKRILEFKKKKVINSEDKKYLELLETKNYDAVMKEPEKPPVAKLTVQLAAKEDCPLVKQIRKSTVLRKVANFWHTKSQHYPTVYKKVSRNQKTRVITECYDLTKHLFGEGSAFRGGNGGGLPCENLL